LRLALSSLLENEYLYSNPLRRLARPVEGNKKYKEVFDKEEIEDDSLGHSFAMHESGLDYIDHYFEIEKEDIKSRYLDFYDLYSKSLLIGIYSLIESKFKEICDVSAESFEKEMKYEHLDRRDYFQSTINYLKYVIQIPTKTIEAHISQLKNIQYIRNRIVHSESNFSEAKETTIETILNQYKGELKLENDTLIITKSTFIFGLFELIKELSEELIWLIDERNDYCILKKGLDYWFKILDRNIFIKNITTIKKGKGKRVIEFQLSSRKRAIPKINCKITLSRAAQNTLEIIDQTDNKTVNEFNSLIEEVQSFLFDYTFKNFNFSSKKQKLSILMY
jgi:hypothetical protein